MSQLGNLASNSKSNCRVEERRGDWGHAASLRFLSPLIEPDVRVSRVQLSDKTSGLRPREATSQRLQLNESQRVVEVLVREASRSRVA